MLGGKLWEYGIFGKEIYNNKGYQEIVIDNEAIEYQIRRYWQR